jgi:hypothetical protein
MLDTEDESRIPFETSLTIYQLPRRNSPEDLNLGVSLYVIANLIPCFSLRMLQILPKLEGLCISENLGVSLHVTVNIILCFGLRMLQILPKLEGLCISESSCNAVLTD